MKEVAGRVLAQETVLLGGWLGDGLPSWGKVETHLNQVNPFWGVKHLDGGARRAIAAARSLRCLANKWVAGHCCCLSCFLH
jgi:hypothetical protein